MVDFHVNVLVASLGVGSAVAILIATAIVVLAAASQRRAAAHLGASQRLTASPVSGPREPVRR